jgi:hypothetical protein
VVPDDGQDVLGSRSCTYPRGDNTSFAPAAASAATPASPRSPPFLPPSHRRVVVVRTRFLPAPSSPRSPPVAQRTNLPLPSRTSRPSPEGVGDRRPLTPASHRDRRQKGVGTPSCNLPVTTVPPRGREPVRLQLSWVHPSEDRRRARRPSPLCASAGARRRWRRRQDPARCPRDGGGTIQRLRRVTRPHSQRS